jgi:hypothetical protein
MPNPSVPPVPAPRVVAQLSIALMESGNVAVRGSIDDLILAYGMLEMAKDAIRANAQQQAASPLLLPPALRMRQRPQPLPPQETQSDVKEKQQETEGAGETPAVQP